MGVSFVSELSWLQAFSPTAALLCVGLVFARLLVNRTRWGALGDQFEHTLFKAIHSGSAKTFPDVLNLYRGIYQKTPSLNHRHSLTSRLRAFLVKLINGTVGWTFHNRQQVGPNLTPDARIAWKELLSQLIRQSELADSIRLRDGDLRRTQTNSRWSVAFAVIGTILTAVFGTLTLLKGL